MGCGANRDPSEAPAGAPFTVRLRAPRDGETVVDDLVQGEIRVANAEMDDMVILRADGSPTYMHAVVVDDHDMAITHVIRGDDPHDQPPSGRARSTPRWAGSGRGSHTWPLIHGPDGAKLSKRHGAQSVVEFREQGILPEALCNYLLRLGWGHGDAEVLSRDEQIRLFDLDGVGRSASRMDYARLGHLNGVWLRAADDGAAGAGRAGAAGGPAGAGAGRGRRGADPAADARPEGAGPHVGRAGGCGGIPGPHGAAAAGPEGELAADPGRARAAARLRRRDRGAGAVHRRRDRRGAAPPCRRRTASSSASWRSRCGRR